MINKKYKDRLFRKIFSDEKNKDKLLDLYNALNGTKYTNPADLEITTIDNVIYLGMKNDTSFLLDSRMSLYEQQSTFNPNMPLRGLMYFSKLYDKYIKKNKYNIFSSKLIKIPTPQYYVFYNGTENYPDRTELKLSDAFQKEGYIGFEWTAIMLNINYGRNKKLLDNCKILRDYAILIDRIRKYQKICVDMEEAVNRAVDECIETEILSDFLLEHKAEVLDMVLTEYNEEETMQMLREEARADGLAAGRADGLAIGRAEGRAEGRLNTLIRQVCQKVKKGKSLEVISDELEEKVENIQPIYETVKKCAPEYDCAKIYEMLNKNGQ